MKDENNAFATKKVHQPLFFFLQRLIKCGKSFQDFSQKLYLSGKNKTDNTRTKRLMAYEVQSENHEKKNVVFFSRRFWVN